MTVTGQDREKILQNLVDAGCSEEIAQQMMHAVDSGDKKKLDALTEKHRKQLLEQFHHTKQCIDCLDYFTYRYVNNL